MPKQDIVVVGASAGGVEALQIFAASLPSDLPAAMFHRVAYRQRRIGKAQPSAGHSYPGRAVTAVHPKDGDLIEKGRIYVAPPDCHFLSPMTGLIFPTVRRKTGRGPRSIRCSVRRLWLTAAA